jgi:hypothetical protein
MNERYKSILESCEEDLVRILRKKEDGDPQEFTRTFEEYSHLSNKHKATFLQQLLMQVSKQESRIHNTKNIESEDLVTCPICKEELKMLNQSHLSKHNTNFTELKKEYPNIERNSRSVSRKLGSSIMNSKGQNIYKETGSIMTMINNLFAHLYIKYKTGATLSFKYKIALFELITEEDTSKSSYSAHISRLGFPKDMLLVKDLVRTILGAIESNGGKVSKSKICRELGLNTSTLRST